MARTQVVISTDMSTVSPYNISVWDIATGNVLTTYKCSNQNGIQSVIGEGCIAVIGDQYLINSYRNTPILNVWSLDKKDRLHSKMILPGNVSSLAVSADGCYCIVAIGSKVYIWQTSTGYLLNVLDKHYQTVSCIKITSDLTYFITGSDDGLVLIWKFASLLVPNDSFSVIGGSSNVYDAFKCINHSSSKINDIHLCESGNNSKFAVCSEDSICKIYLLRTGQVLVNLSFDSVIKSLVMDRSERFLFCGAQNGEIFETKLSTWFDDDQMSNNNNNAGDSSRFIDLTSDSMDKEKAMIPKFTGHTASVTCLAVSIDGHGLVSGSMDHTIKLWHIESHQCMRTITTKGPISNLLLYPALSGLFLSEKAEVENFNGTDVSTDISLATSGLNNKSGKHSSSSFDTRYSKPKHYDDFIQNIQNPPLPITPFKREIFRPLSCHAQSDEDNSASVRDAFTTGFVSVRNDSSSGQQFWPWSSFDVPTIDDIDNIYDEELSYYDWDDLCESNKNNNKSKKLKSNHNESNGHDSKQKSPPTKTNSAKNSDVINISDGENSNDDDDVVVLADGENNDGGGADGGHNNNNGVDGEDDDDDEQALKNKIHKLKSINHQLFSYSVDQIFSNPLQ